MHAFQNRPPNGDTALRRGVTHRGARPRLIEKAAGAAVDNPARRPTTAHWPGQSSDRTRSLALANLTPHLEEIFDATIGKMKEITHRFR